MMAAEVSDEMKNQELAVESRGSFGSAHRRSPFSPVPFFFPFPIPSTSTNSGESSTYSCKSPIKKMIWNQDQYD
jgi:hypothetical protein